MKKNILVKYFVKELFVYYVIAFLFFFMIFFVNQILLMVQDVLKQRVPLGQVMLLMLYCLPFVISQAAPYATLVGFLMCIARMVTDNEILVLRALGISYKALLASVLIMGAGISVGSFVVNDVLLPRGAIAYNNLYRKMLTSNPSVILEPNSVKRTQSAVLVIGDVTGNKVSDLLMFDTDASGHQRIIASEETVIQQPSDSQVLMQLNMHDSLIFIPSNIDYASLDYLTSSSAVMNIFVSALGTMQYGMNPQEMTSYDLKKYIQKLKDEGIESDRYINIFEVEYNRKFALPFSSLFFAFLAFPLAIIFGKHNGQTVGFIVGIVICLLYWTVQTLGQVFGQRNGLNAFWAMWLSDFLVGVFGIIFYAKMRRS